MVYIYPCVVVVVVVFVCMSTIVCDVILCMCCPPTHHSYHLSYKHPPIHHHTSSTLSDKRGILIIHPSPQQTTSSHTHRPPHPKIKTDTAHWVTGMGDCFVLWLPIHGGIMGWVFIRNQPHTHTLPRVHRDWQAE